MKVSLLIEHELASQCLRLRFNTEYTISGINSFHQSERLSRSWSESIRCDAKSIVLGRTVIGVQVQYISPFPSTKPRVLRQAGRLCRQAATWLLLFFVAVPSKEASTKAPRSLCLFEMRWIRSDATTGYYSKSRGGGISIALPSTQDFVRDGAAWGHKKERNRPP